MSILHDPQFGNKLVVAARPLAAKCPESTTRPPLPVDAPGSKPGGNAPSARFLC